MLQRIFIITSILNTIVQSYDCEWSRVLIVIFQLSALPVLFNCQLIVIKYSRCLLRVVIRILKFVNSLISEVTELEGIDLLKNNMTYCPKIITYWVVFNLLGALGPLGLYRHFELNLPVLLFAI